MAGWTDISAWATALSTGLNSLAGGAQATSATITPPTGPRPFYLDLRINLASLTPAAGQSLAIHILPAVDDTPTNFADPNSLTRVRDVPLNTGAAAKYAYLDCERCPVVPFRIALVNSTGGTALAASGNIVEYMTKSEG
jgi:hypothetical protein